MPSRPTRIAVIGAGASGIMTVLELVRQWTKDGPATTDGARVAVHLLDQQPLPGAGVAYGSRLDCHILNMRARSMSLFHDDPHHFTDWLRERTGATPPAGPLAETYPPRHLFGSYLRHCLDECVHTAAAHGIAVDFVQCDVSDLTADPGGDHGGIRLSADRPLPRFDHAILCLGDLPPTSYGYLTGHPRYAPTPWDMDFYREIPADGPVGVLGSSLTAVDTLLALEATGHTGPVYCFSRTRGLPKVQPHTLKPHVLRHLTADHLHRLTANGPLGLQETARLFRRELDDALGPHGWPSPAHPHSLDTAADLAHDIRQAEGDGAHWYEVLDATSPLAPDLWDRMSYTAKAEFLQRYASLWATYRHPMPLVNAHQVARMLAAGRLRVLSGIRGVVAARDGGFDVRRATGGGEAVHRVDRLINATGTGTNPWLLDSALLRNLLHRGTVTTHPLGGIDVDHPTLRVRDRNGQLRTDISFLGPLTNGVHFYTNSIETNLTNAAKLAASLTPRNET